MMYDRARDCVTYSDTEAGLRFLPSSSTYLPAKQDLYWKFTLAVPDIELAYAQLTRRGITVSEPHQFQDVGYVAHFSDPEAFIIELIDHRFAGRTAVAVDQNLLGGGAHLNLLTLRTADIQAVRDDLTSRGMTLIGIQPVDDYGFTLYFFAYTRELPPVPALESIENREWLYQRRYTVIEIQHVHAAQEMIQKVDNDAGYCGAVITGSNTKWTNHELGITATS